jgi:chromosomal replication initiator protein
MTKSGGWESVRDAVRERIGEPAFETWIKPVSGSIDAQTLVLSCPNRFTRDWVRARYGRVLADAANGMREIDYRVDERREASRSERPRPPVAGGAAPPRPPSPAPALSRADSFADFVVGPGNALAHEAAVAIAHGRVGRLSPFVVVGPTGVGKTHLCGSMRSSLGGGVVYRSSEEFTSEVTQAIRSGEMERVRQRYRASANVLILEDIHFLEGRRATQLELFYTVDHLLASGKTVVVSSDRSPSELTGLDEGLRSRLCQGLVAFIRPPEFETRLRILRSKAAGGGVRVPEDCLDILARRPARSVRNLIAGLNQVVARASLLRRPVTQELVEEALHAVGFGDGGHTLGEIIDLVCNAYGLTREELGGRSRTHRIVRPRQIAMYLCRRYSDASLKEIGRQLSRDHTSVMYSIEAVEKRVLERPQLRYELEALAARISPAGSGAGSTPGTRPT